MSPFSTFVRTCCSTYLLRTFRVILASMACAFLVYPGWYLQFISMWIMLLSFYQRMTQSRLSSILIPCLRKLRALGLTSLSLRVCGWVAGLAVWIPLWLWTGLRRDLNFLGFMWAWAISRRATGVLKFVVLKKLRFLGVNVVFYSGARLWSPMPLPCHGFGM